MTDFDTNTDTPADPVDNTTLGDRIRAARAANLEAITADLKAHIDKNFAALHARLDKLETRQTL